MNKRQILASLNKIANELDNNRLYKEANSVTEIMFKLSHEKTAIKWPWQRNKEEEKSQDDYVSGPDLEMSPPLSKSEIDQQTTTDRYTAIKEQRKKEITKYLSNVLNKLSELVTESELNEFLRQIRTWGGASQNNLDMRRAQSFYRRMYWHVEELPQNKDQLMNWIEDFGQFANLLLDGQQQDTPGYDKFKAWVSEWEALTMKEALNMGRSYETNLERNPSMGLRSQKRVWRDFEYRNLLGLNDDEIIEIFSKLYSQFIQKIGPKNEKYRTRQTTLPLDLPPSSYR